MANNIGDLKLSGNVVDPVKETNRKEKLNWVRDFLPKLPDAIQLEIFQSAILYHVNGSNWSGYFRQRSEDQEKAYLYLVDLLKP